MEVLEQITVLFLAALLLSALARRVGAPYPVFLAIGGALLTLLPNAPEFKLPAELVLALFVAPVLLDAAYDASVRDLRDNWMPVAGLVIFAVGLTTAAVAIVVRQLMPGMGWAPAVALGAIVAPPDAVAATAVLRPLRPPQRLLTILEGESLLNDASALLIYRLAVAAATASTFTLSQIGPTFLLAVVGSLVVGPALGWIALRFFGRVRHVPSAIILQFVSTIGVWILAEHIGLSGVLTMVCYAITVAQTAPAQTPARLRIPSYAVWETVVFALNVLAFIFIGLQIAPIFGALRPGELGRYLNVSMAVLITVILVRFAWHMPFNAVIRWRDRRFGFNPPRPMLQASVGSGLIISWSGMRGIVSLAAALALPGDFPFRDLIVLTAFSVVLGTLVIQGLTLKPLLRATNLRDGDPVRREFDMARERALEAGLTRLASDDSRAADVVRQELRAHLAPQHYDSETGERASTYSSVHSHAVHAARQAVLAMRAQQEIGDDAFHQVEEELDWLEVSGDRQG